MILKGKFIVFFSLTKNFYGLTILRLEELIETTLPPIVYGVIINAISKQFGATLLPKEMFLYLLTGIFTNPLRKVLSYRWVLVVLNILTMRLRCFSCELTA